MWQSAGQEEGRGEWHSGRNEEFDKRKIKAKAERPVLWWLLLEDCDISHATLNQTQGIAPATRRARCVCGGEDITRSSWGRGAVNDGRDSFFFLFFLSFSCHFDNLLAKARERERNTLLARTYLMDSLLFFFTCLSCCCLLLLLLFLLLLLLHSRVNELFVLCAIWKLSSIGYRMGTA